MFRKKSKSVFDKINDYLIKHGHELVMSIYLNNYNGNNIYIRFDYVKELSVYKVVWVDLNFFNEKNIEKYINVQMLTKYLSLRIVEELNKIKDDGGFVNDDKILGDRVEVLTYFTDNQKEFVFDRFLPLEWRFLIEPLALVFSYLPRSMEVFLNEIFAKFDGTEESFNYIKPVKFDLLNGNLSDVFKKNIMKRGEEYFNEGKVTFLEKVEDKYFAIVRNDDCVPYLVILHQVNDDFVVMWCSCKCNYYCKHIYAVLRALREKKFNNFYKVKYIGREETLLEKVTISNYQLCFGVDEDKLLLISNDGAIYPADIVKNGKVVFEVIEDDDECSLSEFINKYKMK